MSGSHSLLGPVKLEPVPIVRPWGGFALCERFGKPRPTNGLPLGESWEVSDLHGAVSRIATGPLAGAPLTMVFEEPLPLLIKLIDAREWLSLQVHPDAIACRALTAQRTDGRRVYPKDEAWHILWAEPGAEIVYGTRNGVTHAELLERCARGDVDGAVRRLRVHVGDTIPVPAGTVHSIGPGIILYEVQQPSTATLRLYDWGRLGLDGRPRALHLREAQTVLRGSSDGDPRLETQLTQGPNPRMNLLKTQHFRLDLFLVDLGELVIPERRQMSFLTATAGSGWVVSDTNQFDVVAGDTVLVPPGVDYCLLPGERGLRIIRAVAGAQRRGG